jgi:uncharacterized repeat protein (TIGR01451 family)
VTVDSTLPAGAGPITAAASITDDGTHGADPTPVNNSAGEVTPIQAGPDLQLSKSDGGAKLDAGVVIVYTLTYTNAGNIGATGVTIAETVPLHSTFNAAASPAGWTCAPDSSGRVRCTYPVGSLAAGTSGSVTFAVTVDSPLPPDVTLLSNTASITDDGANGPDPTPSNNAGSRATVRGPTAITLTSFTATAQSGGIVLRWTTGVELNTWGFQLYRSADGRRFSAVRVTPALIPAQGHGAGASYAWTDTTAQPGVTYTYWLQETELDGTTNGYGPAAAVLQAAQVGYRTYLPLVRR